MSSQYKKFSSAIISENNRGFVAVIPDIKCISPKEGDLLQGRDPVEMAKYLVNCGVSLLSVVTEKERFGGSPELLLAITKAVNVPVLRKDFITTEDQLLKTVEFGAASVLLICAITNEENIYELYEKSIELNLEPFVEVHTAKEMELAKKIGAKLIGINNRDITTFELDNGGPSRTNTLALDAPDNALIVSESGILSTDDARLAVSAHANGILVGTALWKAHDIEAMYRSLRIERVVSKNPHMQ